MRKLNTYWTTKSERETIYEALRIDTNDLIKNGWQYLDSGISMDGYRKENIVVKILHPREIGRRDTYLHMRFYCSVPKHFRKYFARVYAVSSDRVVQRYAENTVEVWTEEMIAKAEEVIDKICYRRKIFPDKDIWTGTPSQNIGVIDGTPVFYDFGEESFGYY